MTLAEYWWGLAGSLVILEITQGTFYLLMIAIGATFAAIAMQLGFSLPVQISVLAVVGLFACVSLYLWRQKYVLRIAAQANPDVNLDIGEVVTVEQWDDKHEATVRYRGAIWTVLLRGEPSITNDHYKIVELVSNRFIVEKE